MTQQWKLVPVEPTPEMWAAVNKLDDEMAAGAYDGKGASIEQVWNCLVDAAPGAPAIDGWLDIASAPKTGRTLLLGYWNSHGKWRTVRGQWMSAEYIGREWEDPDGVEAGWFETAVEADDEPNCWPVNPSHWQPMPVPPCLTCNDQGAVGNVLNAQPCPDCPPPASAQDDAKDEQVAFEAWGMAGCEMVDDPQSGRFDIARHCAWEAWKARASVADPAAGDALRRTEMYRLERDYERAKNERLIAILVGIHNLTLPAPVEVDGKTYVFTPPEAVEILRGLSDRIRAIPGEIAASQQQEG
ncbi:hypothetical protein [Achromobacter sp. MFA1 R4]|uniref:hypothetical protein n=1 Tax=Achromobacter sp. MFA1 R4 TaxID=1881016 RepID=UPI00095379F3|nr:hypothetical protein [Achromobacter sp. MFA1 R4]SIT25264.1 hypothetical protein SAMN05428937_2984 [Achromobacter sp. MFA1 R4]